MSVQVRERYDVGEIVADDPLVLVADDMLTADECAHVMTQAAKNLKKAKVSSLEEGVFSDGRTGSVCWIKHNQTPVIRSVVKKLAGVVGLPLTHAESLQVIHYAQAQEYKPHFDAYDLATEKGQRCTANGGQRLVTALVYLNQPELGGGTLFPKLDLEIDASPGRLVLFHNTERDSLVRHRASLHGGQPVLLGEKWACNLWFRAEPYASKSNPSGPPGRGGRPVGRGGAAKAKNRKKQKAARRRNR